MSLQTLTEDEWVAKRLGHATASDWHHAIASTKSGWSTSRKKYATRLILERIQNRRQEGAYHNAAMEYGNATEPMAHAEYQMERGVPVTYAGEGQRFWALHPTIRWAGATPDGLVGEEGAVEFKCPFESHVHLEYYDEGIKKSSYRSQGLFQLACMPALKWIDLVSFDPRMPDHMKLVIQRTHRADVNGDLQQLDTDLTAFLAEIEERLQKYRPK